MYRLKPDVVCEPTSTSYFYVSVYIQKQPEVVSLLFPKSITLIRNQRANYRSDYNTTSHLYLEESSATTIQCMIAVAIARALFSVCVRSSGINLIYNHSGDKSTARSPSVVCAINARERGAGEKPCLEKRQAASHRVDCAQIKCECTRKCHLLRSSSQCSVGRVQFSGSLS